MKNYFAPAVTLGISTKADGPMNWRQPDAVTNRLIFWQTHHINPHSTVSADLTHGNSVTAVTEKNSSSSILQSDGLITNTSDLVLVVTVADCVPIFLYDKNHHAIGLLHAGWRGLQQKIISAGIAAMQKSFDSDPKNITAIIGPAIGPCHFEVQEDVATLFAEKYPETVQHHEQKIFIDLPMITKIQLQDADVPAANINIDSPCTYCHPEMFFSFRRDHLQTIKTMIAYIFLNP